MIRSGGESKIRLIGRRMFIISAAKAVVVFGIVGRLISLQINESKKYKTLSDKNRFREWKFSPPRGLIKDYFGNEIASNKQVYQLHIVPENSENLEVLLFRLKNILSLAERDIFKIRRKIASQKPWDPVVISDNLTSISYLVCWYTPCAYFIVILFVSLSSAIIVPVFSTSFGSPSNF